MTPEERARQIVERFNGITFSEGIGTGWLLSELAAQIAEAQREAARHNEFKSHLDEPFRCPDCFANGFRAAKAKAAFLAHQWADNVYNGNGEMQLVKWIRELAAKIEALEP